MNKAAEFLFATLIFSIVASGIMMGVAFYKLEGTRSDAKKRCRLEEGVVLTDRGGIYCIPRSKLKKM